MTLAVLGLDAADYALAKEWDCDNILLDKHRQLETDSYSLNLPATIEIWPTIATGESPAEHGVVLNAPERDDSVGLSLARRVVNILPAELRRRIVTVREWTVDGTTYPTTDSSHVFENGVVKNWPGITPCEDWDVSGQRFKAFTDGRMTATEFRSQYLQKVGEQLGWLVGGVKAGEPIVGIHVHLLDHMGHAYAERPDRLREYYEMVDELIGMIREIIPNLVILSDHGMQTTVTGDPEPGVHSKRALISTTFDSPLPTSIYDVRSWLQTRVGSESTTNAAGVDAPVDHLEDLGYL